MQHDILGCSATGPYRVGGSVTCSVTSIVPNGCNDSFMVFDIGFTSVHVISVMLTDIICIIFTNMYKVYIYMIMSDTCCS